MNRFHSVSLATVTIISVRDLQIHSSKTLNIRRLSLMDKLLDFSAFTAYRILMVLVMVSWISEFESCGWKHCD